ncbi:MAG: M16 family metallopeptidase [Gemmatimonadaceae bacterium]
MTSFIDPRALTRTILLNGLTVLIYRNDAAPVAAVNTYVKAGYFDEADDTVGIAHVLEHMYFKGTDRLGVGGIAKATKAAGGYLNAHTIYDHTSYYAVLPASGFVEGLRIQADAYANSVIGAEELARELEVIIQEANRKQDNPGAVTTETLYALLHDTHRIRRWRIGRETELRGFTRDKLLHFYHNFYTPSNTVLSIAGAVDPDETLDWVTQLYGALPSATPVRDAGPGEAEHTGFRYRELSGDVQQTQVEIGWRTVSALHPDVPALDLTASVLGSGRASRLYRAVRDRQLAGSVGAYNYAPSEVGVFVVSAESKPEKAAEAARTMWAQVAAVRAGDVKADEVDRAQRLFASRWARQLETVEGQASYLAEWEAMGGWQKGEEYYKAFMALGASAVTDVAQRYLRDDRAAAVVYRPESAPDLAATPADFVRLLTADAPLPLVSPPRVDVSSKPSPERATFEREESGMRVYRTGTGIPVLIRRRAGAAIAHMGVYAAAGSAYEPPAHAGITALAARTASRATTLRTSLQIAEASELLGGSIGASVGSESFGWSLSVPRQNVEPGLELLSDVVQNATIPADALETERAALLADLAQLRDDMYRFPMRMVQEAAYAGHPYAIPAGGTEASLQAITIDDVRQWYRTAMLSAPFVIAITGDVEPDEVADTVAGWFSSLTFAERSPLSVPAWPEEIRERRTERDKAQSALAIAFPAPARDNPDRFAGHVLASIASGLGGRFFEELRDRRSLAYTVHAFSSEHRLAGMFVAYIATSPAREEEARAGLLSEFDALRREPVSDDELVRAKRYLQGMHDIRQERGGAVLGEMVDAWLFGNGLHELEQFHSRVEAVTAHDILQLAQDYFAPQRIVEGVVQGSRTAAPAAAVSA